VIDYARNRCSNTCNHVSDTVLKNAVQDPIPRTTRAIVIALSAPTLGWTSISFYWWRCSLYNVQFTVYTELYIKMLLQYKRVDARYTVSQLKHCTTVLYCTVPTVQYQRCPVVIFAPIPQVLHEQGLIHIDHYYLITKLNHHLCEASKTACPSRVTIVFCRMRNRPDLYYSAYAYIYIYM